MHALYEQAVTRLAPKVLAVAKNYDKHIREMGGSRPPHPVLFQKPWTSIAYRPQTLAFPLTGHEIHHEVELGVVILKTARKVAR
jgi:acylpyruvate hydrolase